MGLYWRSAALFVGDWAVLYLSLFGALYLRNLGSLSPGFFGAHVAPFALVFWAWIVVLYAVGLYEFRRMRNFITILGDMSVAIVLNVVVSVGIFYLISPHFPTITPKTHLALTVAFGHLGLFLWRHLWVRLLSSELLIQKVAFIGENSLIREMTSDADELEKLGFRAVPAPSLEPRGGGGLPSWLRRGDPKTGADVLVMDASMIDQDEASAQEVLGLAIAGDVPLMTHLDFYEAVWRKIPPSHAAEPEWLLSHVLPQKSKFYLWWKRFADFLVAGALLVLFFPLMALIAFLSKLGHSGPAMYTQERVGALGQTFWIWKFRTMVPGAEKAGPHAEGPKAEERVTGLGKFLRRFRLDELPQLWNVLCGHMSLVGPRPEWVEEVQVMEKSVPHYHLRHLVKPGLTGWAQINYRATSNPKDAMEKLHYDLYYVKNLSFALDLGILLKTLRKVLDPGAWHA